MSDFIWPSDADRAENDELNRVCNELEDAMDQAKSDEQMAHIYRVENIKLTGERDALAASVVRLMGALELARDRIALLAEIATDRGAKVYAALDMWPEEMEQTLAETPYTSLARLVAEHVDVAIGHAEALIEAGATVDEAFSAVRRQAEEGSDE